MDLRQLFANRKAALEQAERHSGSYRAMEARARAAGYKISHAQLGAYAAGKVKAVPDEHTRHAIAAALFGDPNGAAYDEVSAAAIKSVAPEFPEGPLAQYAVAFVRRMEGRSEAEVIRTLGVIDALLRALDDSRDDERDTPSALG